MRRVPHEGQMPRSLQLKATEIVKNRPPFPMAHDVLFCHLDADSEGLLVLTDDGGEQHRITDPRHKLPKLDGVAIVRPQRRGFAIRGVGVIGRPSICT